MGKKTKITQHVEIFDPLKVPLSGMNLIEASAGTGKTFSIANLFLRLIVEKGLSIEQVLAVTFTKAATEELKSRIRNHLVAFHAALKQGGSSDTYFDALIKKNPIERSRGRIQSALMNLDQAAIFTIHGFCQRILNEHAFETGSLFDTELVSDQSRLIQEIAEDFWRLNFYKAAPEVVDYVVEKIKGPDFFFKLVQRAQAVDIKIVPETSPVSFTSLDLCRAIFKRLQSDWPESRLDVFEALTSPVLKDNIYGSSQVEAAGGKKTIRESKALALLSEMKAFFDTDGVGIATFKNLEKFTTTKLRQSTKSGKETPRLGFFDLCDELFQARKDLLGELNDHLLHLKAEFFRFAAEKLALRKKESNIQFFNDLLSKVADTLAEPSGNALTASIRRQYKAALVDEFQDTDPIQYRIFFHLFSSNDQALYMIGDPKQAIYGFRGADVFTYMQASRKTPQKYTLTKNWRAGHKMVKAVNTLFDQVRFPFLFEDIPFYSGTSGQTEDDDGASTTRDPAVTIWFVRGEKLGKALPKQEAAHLVATQVVTEIVRLLNFETEAAAAGEIAILVRTNQQAQLMKTLLTRARVPAVLCYAGNVFESHEAMEMERLLTCIAEPYNERRLLAALTTDLLGVTAARICKSQQDTTELEPERLRVHNYFQLWERHGFVQMMRQLMLEEDIRPRLLSLPDGERRLTNVLHLVELLHQESLVQEKGMGTLIKWFSEQRRNLTPGVDMHELRLESDADAVKIVTIHKSKGLEYPVVFCPFLWDGLRAQKGDRLFHDPVDERLTFDLSMESPPEHVALSERELLAENIRLLYVAITRAKKRCYLAWGRIGAYETAPMAYLFHHIGDEPDVNITDSLKNSVSSRGETGLIQDLQLLAERSEGTIEIRIMPQEPMTGQILPQTAPEEELICRKFYGKRDWGWRVFSYSSLVSHSIPEETFPDRDASGHLPQNYPTEAGVDSAGPDIFSFPKGSRAGTFFHDIFEKLDFNKAEDDSLNQLVELKLTEYGFDQGWKETVCRAIQNVLATPLSESQLDLTLSRVSCQDRLNELEFFFPLNSISPLKLKKILIESEIGDFPDVIPERLENLTFAPARGFMKGFMDLLFRFKGRFYLVDWKSNFLGSTLQDYSRDALVKVMHSELYSLQYQIYTLAIHQYLSCRLPDYRYEKDFGGVFYIFLRGIDPGKGPRFGVFQDRPSYASIRALAKAMIPDKPPDKGNLL